MLDIPPQLKQFLDADSHLGNPLNEFVAAVNEILEDNQLFFFPDFTDHGVRHVQKVLNDEIQLLTPGALENGNLTSGDTFLIVVATLLHDLGMHLYKDGFLELLSPERPALPALRLWPDGAGFTEQKEWREMWQGYISEARRWSDMKRIQVFGTADMHTTPASWEEYRSLGKPDNDAVILDEIFGKRLIGEFIRRHHARIAHEIAVFGFPGLSDEVFPALYEKVGELADLAGFVGRSHHHSIRTCADFVHDKLEGNVGPYDSHYVLAMALLRISDYLQLDFKRAPTILFKLRQPQNPVSIREWQKHEIVAPASFAHRDKATILFNFVRQPSYSVFLALQQLLDDVQRELDESNGALFEQYPRGSSTELLRLAFTRIRSNLDAQSYTDLLPYSPQRVEITLDPKIIPLMVRPLYGDLPEFGIRELLQNSVDAVRERDHYCLTRGIDAGCLLYPTFDEDVLIQFRQSANGQWTLTVVDKGIGMTESTIKDCFLRAGASYRDTNLWRQAFTNDTARSQVCRTGTFGVGVFAAFLLGNRIEVVTRHVDEDTGFEFNATLNTSVIELRKMKSANVGTMVSIGIDLDVITKLGIVRVIDGKQVVDPLASSPSWDWYASSSPTVRRSIVTAEGQDISLAQTVTTPHGSTDLGTTWREAENDKFEHLYWSIDTANPGLTCNAIKVGRPANFTSGRRDISGASIQSLPDPAFPALGIPRKVALLDPDGNLPLTLTRDAVLPMQTASLASSLRTSMVLDFLAFSLICAPDTAVADAPVQLNYLSPFYHRYPYWQPVGASTIGDRSLADVHPELLSWFVAGDQVVPFEPSLLGSLPFDRLIFVGHATLRNYCWDPLIQVSIERSAGVAVCFVEDRRIPDYQFYKGGHKDDHLPFLARLVGESTAGIVSGIGEIVGADIIVGARPDRFLHMLRSHGVPIPATLPTNGDRSLVAYRIGSCAQHEEKTHSIVNQLSRIPAQLRNIVCPFAVCLTISSRESIVPSNSIAEAWMRYIGDHFVPLNLEARLHFVEEIRENNPCLRHSIDTWREYNDVWRKRQLEDGDQYG